MMPRVAKVPDPPAPRLRRLATLLLASGFGWVVATDAPGRPGTALAQTPPAAATSGTAAGTPAEAPLSQAALEQMLAPIALYPDSLLMQVLMAATYPLEVVQAKRWLGQGDRAKLAGEALAKALEAEPWDPSVKSLVPFADVLGMMNDRLEWTQALGDAVLAQQDDVFNAVQALRARAKEAGKLESGPQQVVTVTQNVVVPPATGAAAPVVAPPAEIIAIAPADPQTIYVPVYDPSVAFGSWPHPSYPPAYFPPPPAWGLGSALLTGLAFAGGVAAVGSLWGWARPAWGRGYVDVDVNRYNNINVNRTQITGNRWNHDVTHRHGVAYRNQQTANLYRGGDRVTDRAASREQFRGRVDQARLSGGGLDAARPGLGDRPGGGDRPGLGDRPGGGDRPGLGDRPGGGDRPGLGDRPGGGERPGLGDRPGGGNRPGLGDRPGGGDRPGLGDRPGGGDRPGLADRAPGAARPGGGGTAGAGERRPATAPGAAQRPAIAANGRPQVTQPRPSTRPAPQGLQGIGQGGAERAAQQRGAASRASPVAAAPLASGGRNLAAQRGGGGGGAAAASRASGGRGGVAPARAGGGGGGRGGR